MNKKEILDSIFYPRKSYKEQDLKDLLIPVSEDVSVGARVFLDNKNFLCSQVEQRLWSRKYIDKETGLKWDIKGIDSSGGLNLSKEDKVKVLSDYA